jgi:hypothetical protein
MPDSYDVIRNLMVKAAEKSAAHVPEMTEAETSRREIIIVAGIENNIGVE